jgi:hypothetical protein
MSVQLLKSLAPTLQPLLDEPKAPAAPAVPALKRS